MKRLVHRFIPGKNGKIIPLLLSTKMSNTIKLFYYESEISSIERIIDCNIVIDVITVCHGFVPELGK